MSSDKRMVRNAVISIAVGGLFIFGFSFMDSEVSWMATMNGAGMASFVWLLLFMLSGNREVRKVSDEDRTKALAQTPPPGYGLIYVYREGFIGKAAGFDVAINGVTVAQLKSPRFTQLVAPQGRHTVSAGLKAPGGFQSKEIPYSFELSAGETVVLSLRQKMGMMQGSVIVVRESDTRAAMKKLAGITMVAPDAMLNRGEGQPTRQGAVMS